MKRSLSVVLNPLETRSGIVLLQAFLVATIVLFLVTFGDKLTTSPAFTLSVTVLLGTLVLLLVDFKLALFLFLAFLFAYEEFDLSSKEAFLNIGAKNTVLAVRILGVSLMDFLTAALLLPVLIREWNIAVTSGRLRILKTDALLLPLLLLFVYGAIAGAFHTLTFSTYTWDMRDLGQVFVFYFIFSRVFTTRRDVLVAILIGASVFFLKNGVFLYRYFSGGGLSTGGYYRVLIGSDLPLTALLLLLTVSALLIFHPMARSYRLLLLMGTMYFTVILLAGLGKLTYLQALGGLGIIFYLHRREIRLRTVFSVILIGLIGAFTFYFTALSEAGREMISYALFRAFGWWEAIQVYGDLSFGTRLLEIINIWATLVRENAVLFGLGWGAPWYESAALMPFDGGAFDVEEQMSGVHVQAHIDAVKYLLKLGVIGTALLYVAFFRFWIRGVRLYRMEKRQVYKWTLMGLILMVFIFAPNYVYFIRLKFLLGFAFAGIAIFFEEGQKVEELKGEEGQKVKESKSQKDVR